MESVASPTKDKLKGKTPVVVEALNESMAVADQEDHSEMSTM